MKITGLFYAIRKELCIASQGYLGWKHDRKFSMFKQLTRKIHGIFKRLSTANKFVYFENTQIWGISKSGFPAFTPLSIADSYNSLRFYMNNAG